MAEFPMHERTVNTVPDLQHFTPEQIEDYCKEVDGVIAGGYFGLARKHGDLMFNSVQIIRQLQGYQTTSEVEFVQLGLI